MTSRGEAERGAAAADEVPRDAAAVRSDAVPWIDVSPPLSAATPVWEGDPAPAVESLERLEDGAPAALSRLAIGTHTGTHVDAPAHFVRGGLTVDQIPLATLIGAAHVVEYRGGGPLTAADLGALGVAAGVERLLIKTTSARFWDEPRFRRDFVGLDESAAAALVDLGLLLVGIDYLSIEPYGAEVGAVHRLLLGAGVVIVEGLDLRAVPAGEYDFVCAPLRLAGAEAAPARAFVRQRARV